MYPNPASYTLTIQSQGNGIDGLTIFDAATRPVIQKTPNGSNLFQLDIHNLSPGVYIVRADCGGEILTEKLVVAK
ncbi:MAG: T9SS type A sorting domain-containing protein [Flavobacteriales bacterium]|nr:T9SS type A sorting domain-containing protein [Flavobacteriales bacterium]